MRLLGAEVAPGRERLAHAQGRHERGAARLGDQRARHLLRDRLGGRPAPYPTMVRDFQRIIGREAREQILARQGRLPDEAVACVGGGSNAMGLFQAFRDDAGAPDRRRGGRRRPRHASATPPRSRAGRPGVLHGSFSLPAAGRLGSDRSRRTRSRPASTTPASGPSTPGSKTAAAPSTRPPPTTRPWPPSALTGRARGHHPGARERARPGLRAAWPRRRDAVRRGRRRGRQPLGPRRQGRARGGAPAGARMTPSVGRSHDARRRPPASRRAWRRPSRRRAPREPRSSPTSRPATPTWRPATC